MIDRAKLNFDDDDLASPPPPPVPVEQIKAVTRKAGFHETPKSVKLQVESDVVPVPATQRRARLKTGRVHQFATRLRKETVDAFYAYAARHQITVAETLERAQKALLERERDSS